MCLVQGHNTVTPVRLEPVTPRTKKGKGIKRIKNSEYDQEIPQSQTADKPVAW